MAPTGRCHVCGAKASDGGLYCGVCAQYMPRTGSRKTKRRQAAKQRRRDLLKSKQCFYCGAPPPSTIDHYLPKALGGSNALDNLRPCCFTCNQRKADMHPYDWMILLQNERRSQ